MAARTILVPALAALALSTPPPQPGQMPRSELPRAPGASHGPFQRDPNSPPTAACPGGVR